MNSKRSAAWPTSPSPAPARVSSSTSAELRTLFGRTNATMVSRFLGDIPDELLEMSGPSTQRSATWASTDLRRGPHAQHLLAGLVNNDEDAPFKVGDRVRHATFGDGLIAQVSGSGDELILTVAFPKKGIKKLDPQYAKLEKL